MTSRTFGNFIESQTSGDYILNKSAIISYCNPIISNLPCTLPLIKNVNNQSEFLKRKKSIQFGTYKSSLFINKQNLNINLITKLDLNSVPVISNKITGESPSTIDASASVIPYLNYNIDPSGVLFGNSPCGIYNFEHFLVPYCKKNN